MSGNNAPVPPAPPAPLAELRLPEDQHGEASKALKLWEHEVMQRIITQPDSVADMLLQLVYRLTWLELAVSGLGRASKFDPASFPVSEKEFVERFHKQLVHWATHPKEEKRDDRSI